MPRHARFCAGVSSAGGSCDGGQRLSVAGFAGGMTMRERDRVRLHFGPFKPPPFQVGQEVQRAIRGQGDHRRGFQGGGPRGRSAGLAHGRPWCLWAPRKSGETGEYRRAGLRPQHHERNRNQGLIVPEILQSRECQKARRELKLSASMRYQTGWWHFNAPSTGSSRVRRFGLGRFVGIHKAGAGPCPADRCTYVECG